MTYHCPSNLRFNGNHILTSMFFKNFISLKRTLKSFIVVFLKSSDHFVVFLFVLITSEPILDGFLAFGKIQKLKMADQDGRHSEMITQLLRHVMSSPHGTDVKGDNFRLLSTL